MTDMSEDLCFPRVHRALFLSDLHLGSLGCRADLVLEFLHRNTAPIIYLVGDILDIWHPLRVHWTATHDAIMDHLCRQAEAGVRLVYLVGNHDADIRRAAGHANLPVEIAEDAARLILPYWRSDTAVETKSDDSPVTQADRATMPGLRCVVLSGEGKAFCAGLDMGSFAAMKAEGDAVPGVRDLTKRTHGIANRPQQCAWLWRELPVPVIAAVHGVAFGGGFQIMLGADIRYATADARFSVMEIKWGLVPDLAGTQLMRHLAREDVVRELTYTGRIFNGTEDQANFLG